MLLLKNISDRQKFWCTSRQTSNSKSKKFSSVLCNSHTNYISVMPRIPEQIWHALTCPCSSLLNSMLLNQKSLYLALFIFFMPQYSWLSIQGILPVPFLDSDSLFYYTERATMRLVLMMKAHGGVLLLKSAKTDGSNS